MTSEPDNNTLFAAIRAAAAGSDWPFIVSDAGTVTYGAMLNQSAQYAAALVEAGLKPGDRVTVQSAKTVECLLFHLGVIRAGGVYQPLNTGYTMAEVEYFLNDAEPAIVIVDVGEAGALRRPVMPRS